MAAPRRRVGAGRSYETLSGVDYGEVREVPLEPRPSASQSASHGGRHQATLSGARLYIIHPSPRLLDQSVTHPISHHSGKSFF